MKSKFISEKTAVPGRWVAIMDHKRNERNLKLSSYKTRCFSKNQIHEFLVCDENTNLANIINEVTYLGFGEFTESGVVEIGDTLICNGIPIGKVSGFDESHMPNHYNILIQSNQFCTGEEIGLQPFDRFTITKEQI